MHSLLPFFLFSFLPLYLHHLLLLAIPLHLFLLHILLVFLLLPFLAVSPSALPAWFFLFFPLFLIKHPSLLPPLGPALLLTAPHAAPPLHLPLLCCCHPCGRFRVVMKSKEEEEDAWYNPYIHGHMQLLFAFAVTYWNNDHIITANEKYAASLQQLVCLIVIVYTYSLNCFFCPTCSWVLCVFVG